MNPDEMSDLDRLLLFELENTAPRPGAAPARKCQRHVWRMTDYASPDSRVVEWRAECLRCGTIRDDVTSRRNRNNRRRGVGDELAVARILGGRKVGPLGHPWDVEIPGYLRAQAKKLTTWPSLAKVIEWLDAIPAGPELRAVTLADAPGHGKVRRLIVMDLEEFARWHGGDR